MTNSGTQRAELHKTIWSIANVLRGSVDGWDFKQYVLGFLFYRFISEDITSYLNEYEHQAGDVDFDYAKLNDATAEQVRKSMVEEKGYFILPSDLFANVRRRADADENLNETLQRVFKNIEGSAIGSRSESSLRGLFDDLDLNSRKLGDTVVERNAKLVKVLNAMNVGKALIVLSDKDEIVERAARNIPGVKTTLVSTLNVYEILKYNTLILTKDSVAKIEEVYA